MTASSAAALPLPAQQQRLLARLHLGAVLPALPRLAAHDDALRTAAAGRRDLPVVFTVRDLGAFALTFASDGTVRHHPAPEPPPGGALRLWYPNADAFVRGMNRQPALVLPTGGWTRLGERRRIEAAAARFETLLRAPEVSPRLFAYGNLAVGLAAAAVWLRFHPQGPAHRRGLLDGVIVIGCAELPDSLWIDTRDLTTGGGPPRRPPLTEITFRDLAVMRAELAHTLDSMAALGGGELRIRGHAPVAERLNLVLAEVDRLLNPA